MDIKNSDRYDLLVKVAELYYLEKKSQQEISDIVHLSRSNISKMLKTCVDTGIVEFKVNSLLSSGIQLQKQIKENFNMKEVIVVPARGSSSKILNTVGKAAAQYLESLLKNGMLMGITWGSTTYQTVRNFNPKMSYAVDVVQLVGSMGSKSMDGDGQVLVKQMQEHLNGTGYVLQAPMMVKSKIVRELLLDEPEIKNHFDLFSKLDVAIIGLGSNRSSVSALYKAGHISMEEANKMIEQGAIGDICGTQIDIFGNICKTTLSGRVVGIPLSDLKEIPIRIGVASGLEKTDAILGALRGGFVNVLVTDELTAQQVTDMA